MIDHIPRETIVAVGKPRFINIVKKNRNITLAPISAGTTATDLDAKFTSVFNDIKMNATTIVDGNVPRKPPTLVPNFSAMTVIMITINADKMNGMIT